MSLEIDWKALDPTIARSIKSFLNLRLKGAELPGFLRNVEILSFDLGSIPPEIVINDIADPFDEFYEDESERELEEGNNADENGANNQQQDSGTGLGGSRQTSPEQRRQSMSMGLTLRERRVSGSRHLTTEDLETASVSSGPPPYAEHHGHRPMNSASGWEGMNVPYFHSAFATPNSGIVSASGLSTPRPRFMGWSNTFQPAETITERDGVASGRRASITESVGSEDGHRRSSSAETLNTSLPERHAKPEDTQIEVQIKYAGDIVVKLKVDLALNYPSPFFVTLPIEMAISELYVDTIGVIAYIDGKVHVSLLEGLDNPIKEFKIKSQIGDQDKVSLTDVDKVEKFMLREIQAMVESELVFPSYYTILL